MIQLPKPCSEKWEQMTPGIGGNFCSSCNKLILDFTNKTDREIQDYLDQNGGVGCGKFRNNQLNRELNVAEKELGSFHLHRIFAGLLLVSASNDLQSAVMEQQVEIQSPLKDSLPNDGFAPPDSSSNHCIEGKVIDSLTQEPIFGATIRLKDYPIYCQTDLDGKFRMEIPDSIAKNEMPILIRSIYEDEAQEIMACVNQVSVIELSIPSPLEMATIGLFIYKPKWWQIGKKTKYFVRRTVNRLRYS